MKEINQEATDRQEETKTNRDTVYIILLSHIQPSLNGIIVSGNLQDYLTNTARFSNESMPDIFIKNCLYLLIRQQLKMINDRIGYT